MGLFWRLLAPKPLKKARRAMHPVSLITPRPVRNAKRAAAKAVNPVGALGDAVENQLVRAARQGGKKRGRPTSRERADTVSVGAGDTLASSDVRRLWREREWFDRFNARNKHLVALLDGVAELMADVADHEQGASDKLRRRTNDLATHANDDTLSRPPTARLNAIWAIEQRRNARIISWTTLLDGALDTGEVPDDRVDELQGFFDVMAYDYKAVTSLGVPLAETLTREADELQ